MKKRKFQSGGSRFRGRRATGHDDAFFDALHLVYRRARGVSNSDSPNVRKQDTDKDGERNG